MAMDADMAATPMEAMEATMAATMAATLMVATMVAMVAMVATPTAEAIIRTCMVTAGTECYKWHGSGEAAYSH